MLPWILSKSVADPEFPLGWVPIFGKWGEGGGGDANTRFCQIFPKTDMKLKEFETLGEGWVSQISLC